MPDFRFGCTLASQASTEALVRTCRTAEAHGFDLVVTVDHLGPGRASPFLPLLAAAQATERLQVGTYVLNAGFWNPSILAREVATLVRLTGRFELGIGAGQVKAEFDAAGLPWHPFPERLRRLESTLDELDKLLAAEADLRRPPLLLPGGGERALRMAAHRADTVGFAGIAQLPGHPPGTFRHRTAEETDAQVALVREVAGSRYAELESDNFVKAVEITDDRRAVVERMATEDLFFRVTDVEAALDTPYLLIGTVEEMARQVLADHERYGFDRITVELPHAAALAPVIERVRQLA